MSRPVIPSRSFRMASFFRFHSLLCRSSAVITSLNAIRSLWRPARPCSFEWRVHHSVEPASLRSASRIPRGWAGLHTSPHSPVTLLRRASAPQRGAGVVAIGEPHPAEMAELHSVSAELDHLARIYPHAAIHTGGSVAPADFLRLAAQASLVSFSGHATGNALVFESRAGAEALMLTAREVAQARLDSHPTVILGACGTGTGRLRRSEGVESLATAFVAAGARSVIGTLW